MGDIWQTRTYSNQFFTLFLPEDSCAPPVEVLGAPLLLALPAPYRYGRHGSSERNRRSRTLRRDGCGLGAKRTMKNRGCHGGTIDVTIWASRVH
jgi:hypothetical protein